MGTQKMSQQNSSFEHPKHRLKLMNHNFTHKKFVYLRYVNKVSTAHANGLTYCENVFLLKGA